jgi:acyl transferase domain-containing protein
MLSPDGQCKAFDDSANGIVVADGVGAVVLKRLSNAEADGDHIYGVILGSGINQDGKTNGITAPSVNSQVDLIREIYTRYDIDPETISYVETHGTGTRLGDPIELEALDTVFKERTARRNYCALASVKTNIGHTVGAAGVVGLQKVLLSMQNDTLVPSLNIARENPLFDFAGSPFYINRETRHWAFDSAAPRRAGISSFGFSGTNSHLVVEEYTRTPASAARNDEPLAGQRVGKVIVPLSARTVEQLQQKARDLLEWISLQDPTAETDEPGEQTRTLIDLRALAYTLQVGRDPMQERLSLVVDSLTELVIKLRGWLEEQPRLIDCFRGSAQPALNPLSRFEADADLQGVIEKWMARGKLSRLAELWAQGVQLNWAHFYRDATAQRVSLPGYPFAKERYWVESAPTEPGQDSDRVRHKKLESIEEIITQIDNSEIETNHAVSLLNALLQRAS